MTNKISVVTRILRFLVTIIILTVCISPAAYADVDPLPSWNEGARKKAILEFVRDTTTKGNANFVAPEERIATFDQDGTLWVEQPNYTQLEFAKDQVKTLAPQHPEWKTTQPYATLLSGDLAAQQKLTADDFTKIVATTHSGMTIEQFSDTVKKWIATAKHPRFNRPYTELVYLPMLEVMHYLRDNGYQTYIVSGGGQQFIRAFAEQVYGIPPQQVIGSTGRTKYEYAADGKSELIKEPKVLLIDDKEGKPEDINLFIGRRPYAAFGNSTGDREMLEWTQSGSGKRLMMLVHHDDDVREYAYGTNSNIGPFSDALMAEARKRDWRVISMKNDWKKIFIEPLTAASNEH